MGWASQTVVTLLELAYHARTGVHICTWAAPLMMKLLVFPRSQVAAAEADWANIAAILGKFGKPLFAILN